MCWAGRIVARSIGECIKKIKEALLDLFGEPGDDY